MLPDHPAALMTAHHLCRDAELQRIEGAGAGGGPEWVVVLSDDAAFTVPAAAAEALARTPGAQLLDERGGVAVHIVPIPDRAMVREWIRDALMDLGASLLDGAAPLAVFSEPDDDELARLRSEAADFAASYAPAARGAVGGLLLAALERDLAAGAADPEVAEALAFVRSERGDAPPPDPAALEPAGAADLLESGAPALLLDAPEHVDWSAAVWGVAAALYAALELRADEA